MTRLDSRIDPTTETSTRAQIVGGVDDREIDGLAEWLADAALGSNRTTTSRHASAAGGDIRADSGHVPVSTPRLLIYAPGVAREHPERLAALRDGRDQVGCAELLHRLVASRSGIAIVGRKQGGVAAAMIAWTLECAGLDPTILLRRRCPQLDCSGRSGRGRHAVVDITGVVGPDLAPSPGPESAVILDVDDLGQAASESLRELTRGVSAYLLTNPEFLPDEAGPVGRKVESFSLVRGGTWWGADLREDRGRFRFRAFHRGRFAGEVRLQIPGRSSVLSALATIAVCHRAEVPLPLITAALEDFEGVTRGFQPRGSYRGVTLVDDHATEPGDLAEAIALARSVYGRRRLWAVLGPIGPPDLTTVEALAGADRVSILADSVDAGDWSGMLEGAGVVGRPVEDLDAALEDLDRNLEPGDVLLTLGTGDVGMIADAFIRRLSRDHQGR